MFNMATKTSLIEVLPLLKFVMKSVRIEIIVDESVVGGEMGGRFLSIGDIELSRRVVISLPAMFH